MRRLAIVAAMVVVPAFAGAQGKRPPGAEWEGKAFTFTQITDGVWHAVGTGALAVGANGTIIVNDSDVVVVDSHISPAAAWALQEELKAITTKPIRTVIVTHFHYDHAHGSQIYPPGTEIIGHEFTRSALLSGMSKSSPSYQGLLRVLTQRRDSFTALGKRATSDSARETARTGLRQVQRYQAAIDAVVPTPPNVTLSQSLTLWRGSREILVAFHGRGHTGGDVVVYLPKEKILVTGDLVGSGLPYLGDGYIDEWATTLDAISALDWEVILPGHGAPVRDRGRPKMLASLLRDFHRQATAMLDRGMGVDEIEPKLDFASHVGDYPALANRGSEDMRERFTLGLLRIRELRGGK